MKKHYQAFLAILCTTLCIMTSCNSENDPSVTDSGSIYRVVVEVNGNSPKGNLHLYNLDGVAFRNEQTGERTEQVNESFTSRTSYVTDGKVCKIAAQGILYSKEDATLTMNVYKDGETVFSQSKQLTAVPGTDTTIDLVYSTVK